jgi:DNA-binding IclR family transcriptional regulator
MDSSIRSVKRALTILACFSANNPELSMTQIAEQVGLHKSTTHRLLATLEEMRFVQRSALTNLYQPGIRFLQVASLVSDHNDLRRILKPHLVSLCDRFEETIDLSILDGKDVIFLDVVESKQRVKLAAAVGQRLPAFCTASGKAFLAFLPKPEVDLILSGDFPQYTPSTATSLAEILEDLAVSRERGFALSEQEYEEGINTVASPILDGDGYPIAVIAVAGPAFRFTEERLLQVGPELRQITRDISLESNLAGKPVSA